MRTALVAFVAAASACLLPSIAAAATNCIGAAPGLVEWWPGDGSANGILAGNNGALQGNSIASAPGVVGTAFSFDGTNGYVQISDSPTFDQANLTISAWVQFKSLESQGSGGSPAGDQYIVFKQNSRNSSFEGFDLSKTRISGGDRFRFLIASAAGVSTEIDGATILTAGVWYHVAAVRGSNFTQIYVNGQLDAQGSVSFAQDYGTLPLYFGTSGQTFWDHKLNGYLDEVSLYNRALSAAEIAAEYAAGTAGKCKSAAIVSQSQSQNAVLGTNITLNVNATGYGSLTYQWRFNNTSIGGATTSALALNNVQATNAGSYTVVVANTLGSVTSSVIALTVLLPPSITTQPVGQTVNSGATAGFSVSATGSAPLAYQWLSNGSALPGATTSTLTLANVQPANSGTYTVVVTNSVGAVTSSPAILTVLVPPAFTLQPQSVTNSAGTTANFTASASGSAPLSYQWRLNGLNLSSGGRVSGATTGNLSISGVQLSDAGSYTLVVSNQAGIVTSVVASLTVLSAPAIVVPPANISAAINSNADFTVTAAGSAPLSYQWQFNGTNVSGATATALLLTNIALADAGSYAVIVSNSFGSITSTPGILTVLTPPFITAQPQSITNIPAANASFAVIAGGSAPLGYRWRLNGVPLTDGGRTSGSASATLTISSLQAADGGSYSVVITNSVGSVTSQVASLTVLAPPTITAQPADATVMAGTSVGFAVSATGPGPLGYQWRFNGAPVADGTASTLIIPNAQPTNAGSYLVVVSNIAGVTTSSVATLTVLQPTACVSPGSGLAGWWTGDGNANDVIAGNNGTLQGAATANAVGKVGPAFSFDGVNSYVQIPDAAALRPANFTIEAWIQFTGLDGPGTGTAPAGDQYIIFKQNSQNGDFEGFDLSKTRNGGSDVFRFLISSGAGQSVEIDSTTTLAAGVWYHIAIVRGAGTMQMYVNGQLENQANISFAQNYGTLPLYFGTSGQSFWDRKFYGLLDEVSLYNRALTAQEIAAVYAAGADGKCKAPSIADQPQSQSVLTGATASFEVSATGLTPLGYQWQFNGNNIPGATSTNLSLANVQPSQAGTYTVIVSNSLGSVQSAGAVLWVLTPPAIAAQPLSATNLAGSDVEFSVTANGTQPLAYQWLFNGAVIPGASEDTLALQNIQTSAAGSYRVVVTNSAGAVTSSVASLTVWVPAEITSQPASSTNLVGTGVTFSVGVIGTPAPGFQWFLNGNAIAGAVDPTLTIPSVQLNNAGTYTVAVTNIAGAVTSAPAVLTVWATPAIVAQPQSRTNLAGSDVLFTVSGTGTPAPAFQWQFNNAPIPGATTTQLALSSVQPANAGTYTVVLSNIAGAITSAPAVLTVWVPPTITTQPQSETNYDGTDANFNVTAAGTQPLGYQWYFNGAPVGGANAATLAVSSVEPANAGSYYVVVTNVAGSVTSSVAALTVWVAPSLSAQPQSRTNIVGTPVTFTVTANGTQPLAYQWRLNGANLYNGTGVTYTIASVDDDQAGSYSVVVTNIAGTVTSASAILTIWNPPGIVAPPQSQTNFAGSDVTFDVTATGTEPLAYQWQWNGTNIPGATTTSLPVSNVQNSDAGSYAVVVTNIAGAITSSPAALVVWTPPSIIAQPQSRTNISGTDALFSIGVTGTAPLSYQWRFNGTPIPAGTNGSLLLSSVQLTNAGSYSVIVTNQDGAATSAIATLTVWVLPVFSTQPQSQTNLVGAGATLTAAANGTQPLGYQWQFNGVAIGGATNTSLSLNSLQLSDGGSYTVVATNIAGATTSGVAMLTVWAPPAIATQPLSRTNLANSDATFSVAATGTAPLGYQWSVNGSPINGATAATLTLNSVQTNNAGSYAVVITNVAGAITSSPATLIVWVPPTFTSQPLSLTNLAGTTANFSAAAYGTAPLAYQWQSNGTNVPGANTPALSLANVQTNNAGSYALVITNIAGAATSSIATLTVWVPPTVAIAPQSRTNLTGSDVTFNVSASGTQPLSYQWLFNGNAIGGATGAGLTLTNAQLGAAGSYAVVVTNVAGAITSSPATLTMWALPAIAAQPQSRTNLADSSATFSVTATGTAPLSYQWLFNGTAVANATNAALSLGSVQLTNAGSYSVVITNIAGAITSADAVLTVWVPPSITLAPSDRTNLVGTTTTFTVAAAGTQPLRYQWQLNGTNVPGATNQDLTLNPVNLNHAGAYTVIVTNVAAAVTSTPALFTVWVPPTITTQPQSITNNAGTDAIFHVTATGMEPLNYQWRLNGAGVPGATSNSLTVVAVQADEAGTYDVVITNFAGAITSSPAALTVSIPAPYRPGAGAVILVNSHSTRYADFQRFIQPYLDNFGFPYVVQDISTNPPTTSLTNYAVIIVGHSQLDTNEVYLTSAAQAALSLAVSNGTGLVNFDNNLASNNSPRYEYIQDIFGFSYGSSGPASNVSIPATEPGGKMQYISALHATNDTITFRTSITMPGITSPSGVTNIALSGGKPMVAIRKYGAGRAVQWGSYDWMVSTTLGPLEGLDDLIWRGIVWAGRKPLVMRGMPNLVSFRIDDVSGPVWWGHIANEVGMKPYFAMFLNDISESTAADIRGMVTNGNATAAIHSFGDSTLFYFDHQHETANSDTVQSNNFYVGTQWHINHGIPISKVCATHYSEIGVNAFAGLKNWGMEFVPIEVVPGTVEYAPPYAPWVVAGPYRLYETPQQGQVNWPMLYADWLVVPGHPEFTNTFFNPYCEIRDAASCNEWCPDNDVTGSINRGTTMLKRALDSMAMAVLFTHEWYFHPTPCCGATTITTNNLRAEFQGITNNLAAYKPIFVTLDYASQYMRATRTAKLVSAEYDPGSGQVTATFTGKADLDLTVYVFLDDNGAVVANTIAIPAFTNTITAIVASLPPQWVVPNIVQGPTNQTVLQGSPAAFSVRASGTAPFSYQWSLNGTNLPGANHSALSLAAAQAFDAGSYQATITNAAGATTSAVAVLSVLVPPTAIVQTTNEMAVSGSTVTLAAAVTGTEPMAYQWRLDNTDIPGAQVETLVLTNVSPQQAGDYELYVTNMAGVATSAVVTLTVIVPPSITLQPSNTLALAGSSVQFTAAATGTEPLTYQWLFNGSNVDGANGLTLTLANVQPAQSGGYSLLVSNAGGASNSAVAMLTVANRPLLLPHRPTNGMFNFTLLGDPGLNYMIEASTNWLLWDSLSLISNTTGQVDFTDPASTNMRTRIYRARLTGQ